MQPSSQITRLLDGVSTEVVMQTFADRTLVLITQLGKVGNLIDVSIPATAPLLPPISDPSDPNRTPLPPPPPSIQLTPLLGYAPSERMQTLHSLYASQVATLLWAAETDALLLDGGRRGVAVGIALRQPTEEVEEGQLSEREKIVFHGVMDMVKEIVSART